MLPPAPIPPQQELTKASPRNKGREGKSPRDNTKGMDTQTQDDHQSRLLAAVGRWVGDGVGLNGECMSVLILNACPPSKCETRSRMSQEKR